MSKAKHTPGPWKAGSTSDSVIAPNESGGSNTNQEYYGGFLIAETVSPRNRPLVIAAPDLLAALENLTGGMWIHEIAEENPAISRLLQDARAAIAKATGE